MLARFAAHGLERLHAVQPLKQARHEGLLQLGLIPSRAPADGDQPVEREHAEGAGGQREQRDLPGYREARRQVDQGLNAAREDLAGRHVGVCRARRLDADRARQIAGPPIDEVQPARPQDRSDERAPQVHRDMGRGIADLRHREQREQRLERHGDDDQDQQPAEGHVLAGKREDLLGIARERPARAPGVDHQADHRQQRGDDADALCERGRGDRQQHERAAHGIGRKEVPEQAGGIPRGVPDDHDRVRSSASRGNCGSRAVMGSR